MSVRFNSMGTQILALRRRLPPILYGTSNEKPICQFYHPDYYNSCTMKSGSFAGENDEYILSGSDDFNMYMWRTTDADRECLSLPALNINSFVSLHYHCSRQDRSICGIGAYGVVWPSFDCQPGAIQCAAVFNRVVGRGKSHKSVAAI